MSGCPRCQGPLKFDAYGTWCHRCGRNPDTGSVLPGAAAELKYHCTVMGCPNPAVRLWYMPEGSEVKADSYQGLCGEHELEAEANGAPKYLVKTLTLTPSPSPPPPLRCADCGLLYASDKWCDCVVTDDVWRLIENGVPCVLCFNCMAGRLVQLGMEKVPVTIRSGPFLLAWDVPEHLDRNIKLESKLERCWVLVRKLEEVMKGSDGN